jgi:hypothetical protein
MCPVDPLSPWLNYNRCRIGILCNNRHILKMTRYQNPASDWQARAGVIKKSRIA